jgi:azurin
LTATQFTHSRKDNAMQLDSRSSRFIAAALAVLLGTWALPAAGAEPRTIKITGNDAMQFSVKRIDAKPGEKLKIVLTVQGSMGKAEMAHNWVLLAAGTDVAQFIMAAAMARTTAHIPAAKKAQVLAATGLAGAGETVTVELAAPGAPGEYVFVCTFPGHYNGGMVGKLVVTG